MMDLLRMLDAPEREFTPIPFWFLNGDLDEEEIDRQLRVFHSHGVYGVVLHPRMGLPRRIEYLSETFFRYIRRAVETAARLQMTVVLYDEGMYPSGSAGGLVVRDHPELKSLGLTLTDRVLPGDQLLAETDQGALVVRPSGGTIRGLHEGEDDGEPDAPPSADILNPVAVERFLTLTHEAYYRELKPWFGNTIIGFFTDEPSVLGRNVAHMFPWTRGFEEQFTAAGGALAALAALFTGEENESTRLYHRLILRRESEVYYAALSNWCEAHGICLMGHPHQSDDIEVERYFHIPGQDLVFRWVSPERGDTAGMDSTMAKCSADAARLMGRRRNLNECFGACNREDNPWHFTGGDMKWMLDYLAVRGVNLFIPHAFYYSIEGKRSGERPPDVGPHSIWWPHYRPWALYMSRLSALMTDASLQAETAVLCRNRDLRPGTVAPLFEQQIGFQYLPESVWSLCREENGALLLGDRRFSCVLGEEDRFPTVPHTAEGVRPDCLCDPPQPTLRCARLDRLGQACWFLVNAGEQAIHTALTLPTSAHVGRYDLWEGRAERCETLETEDGAQLRLALGVRESLLLFACTQEEWDALPAARGDFALPCPDFTLIRHDAERQEKEYQASLSLEREAPANAVLTLEAEEMAELRVNGQPASVSFFSPHRFRIGQLLREGENELRLTVTGSPANRYGVKPVFYGLVTVQSPSRGLFSYSQTR